MSEPIRILCAFELIDGTKISCDWSEGNGASNWKVDGEPVTYEVFAMFADVLGPHQCVSKRFEPFDAGVPLCLT